MSTPFRFPTRALGLAALLTLPTLPALAQRPPASALVQTTTKRPDEFGTQSYAVTVIQASSFTSDQPAVTHFGDLTRDFGEDFLGDTYGGHFYVGVVGIPAGAIIDFVGFESYAYASDFDPQGIATLFYVDRYSGTTSGIVSVPSSAHGGHGYDTDYNAAALGWQLVQNAHNALVLDIYIPGGVAPEYSVGWVEIWWRRSVSAPPASPTFGDVPTADPGYQYIEALAASGITGGCGAGNYCPDAKLTRRQMAVFLAKALGLHWPY